MSRAAFVLSLFAAFGVASARAESISSPAYRRHLGELVEHAKDLTGTHGSRGEACSLSIEGDRAERWYFLSILGPRDRVLATARIPTAGAFEQTLEQDEGFRTETTEVLEGRFSRALIRIVTYDDTAGFDLSITEIDGHHVKCALSE